MILLTHSAHVDIERCTGWRLCERVCPSGAIRVVKKKGMVDTDRCIDCGRCIDRCNKEEAIGRVARASEVLRFVDDTGVDQGKITSVCAKEGVLPDLPICGCTRTTAREAVAAIIKGAATPEELCAMTGLRAGCGIYWR